VGIFLAFRKNSVFAFVILSGLVRGLFPGLSHAEGYSLNQALLDAYAYDHRVGAAQAALSSAEEGIRQAEGLRYPSISGFGAASLNDNKRFNDQGTFQQNGPRTSVGVELNQSIYTFGRFRARKAGAAAAVTGAQAGMQGIRLQVYFEAGEAFAEARLAQDIMALFDAHYATLLELYQATEAKFEVDLTTATDVRLVRSRLEQADAERVSAASRYRAAMDRLSRLTNQEINMLDVESMKNFMHINIPGKDDAVLTALAFSPVIHSARSHEMAARAEMDLNASDLWPSLGVRGRTSRGVLNGQVIGSDEVGLVLNVPLWDGGIARSLARAGRHLYEQSRQDLRNAQDQVRDNVTSAWHNIRGTTQSLAAWQRAVEAEAASVEGIEEEVDEGLRPITHLLEAKEDMVITRTRALNTGYDAFIARLLLAREMGTLDQRIIDSP
jgi:outer membrane protein